MKNSTYYDQMLKDLFDDFDPSGSTGLIYETTMSFSQLHVAPLDRKLTQEKKFPEPLWQRMGEQGLLGVMMPAEYGGSGLGHLALYATISALSYGSGSVGLSMLAHSKLCMDRINAYGVSGQKEKYLPKLINGDWVGALAMSEPDAGSDVVKSMQTKATAAQRDGVNGFVLDGQKTWITNGARADVVVVYARTKPDKLTAFIVEKGTPGFTAGPNIDKIGMCGSETNPLYFDDCFVPAENVLFEVDKGAHVLMDGLNGERYALAAIGDGLIRHALDETRQHVMTRSQFGAPLYTNQGVSFPLADATARLDMLQDSLCLTANIADQNSTRWTNAKAAMIFLNASQTAVDITQECIKLDGGMGYTQDYAVGRCHNDGLLLSTGGGTENVRRILIGRDIFKP